MPSHSPISHFGVRTVGGILPNLMVQGLVAFLAMIALTSCAHHYRLDVPADVADLPFRRGSSGFNVVAYTPWRYMGSHYQTHEFRYHYNRDNALDYRDVSVARD